MFVRCKQLKKDYLSVENCLFLLGGVSFLHKYFSLKRLTSSLLPYDNQLKWLKLAFIRDRCSPTSPLALFIDSSVAKVNYTSGLYVNAFFPFPFLICMRGAVTSHFRPKAATSARCCRPSEDNAQTYFPI